MDRDYFVHESSFVDAPAEVGAGTSIWHFSHVMGGAVIGSDCVIGQNVFIDAGVRIGNHCKIQNNVSLYNGVELEDNVFCGPSMVFTNVMNPRSEIASKDALLKTVIRTGASIGANATILCGNTVGAYAFVGAGAVVTRDIPDFALVFGSPARIAGWICRCGVRLRAVETSATCTECHARYTLHLGVLNAES